MTVSMERIEMKIASWQPSDKADETLVVKVNPFRNLLEMITFYHGVAERNNPDELDAFLDNEFSKNKDKYPKLVNVEDMNGFIIHSVLDSLSEDNSQTKNEAWMDFDVDALEKVLRNPFFEEYNKKIIHRGNRLKEEKVLCVKDTVKVCACAEDFTPDLHGITVCARDYGLLELYTYTRLQAQAACALSDDRTNMMWHLWCYQDLIEQIYENRFYDCIAMVYKKYGKEWFAHSRYGNQGLDPILYKWASYGVFATREMEQGEARQLKHDLVDLLSEFILSLALADRIESNTELVDYIKESIANFDTLDQSLLQKKIEHLEHENIQIKKDYETLRENYEILRTQIEQLQADATRTDEEKIEAILKRIYAFMPEDISFDQNTYKFSDIWERFAPVTQKDIKTSLAIYDQLKTPDLAAFLFVSSLDREMNRNFFEPFKKSAAFGRIKNRFCSNSKLLDVHKALADSARGVTLGNIPFIKKAILSQQSLRDSEIVAAFAKFLGKERASFCGICDAIEKYRLGAKKYTVVKLRNGLAHGDEEVKTGCDENCYSDLTKMLYEPPIQIMFSIIAHSKRI